MSPPKTPSAGTIYVPSSPLDLLLPYQRAWVDDDWRFKIGLMSRQVGKDFSGGGEGVRDCFAAEQRGEKTTWMIIAPSERQSLESMEKWKEWTEAFSLAIEDIEIEREDARNSETLLKSATIIFPGGSRVIAVPGKPDTVRGFSANAFFTEFAFFEDPDKTWRAALPSITNPLRGGVKKVRIISTPNGQGNKFHDLCSKAVVRGSPQWRAFEAAGTKGLWSLHKTTIHDAVAQGLPIDIEELRDAIDDPEGWAQEFECVFLDAAAVLLPYEVIALMESQEATEIITPEYWTAHSEFPVDLGIDFGRKRNLTVSWACEMVADLQVTKEVLCLQNMSTPDQVEALRPRIGKARRVSLDYTGPGVGFGDYLVKEFGEWNPEQNKFGKIELVTMSNPIKVEIFSKLAMSAQRRTPRIPVSRSIREDLHSVYRVVSTTGTVTYRAPNNADGHADRCTALALAVRAGSFGGTGCLTSVEGIRVGKPSASKPTFKPRRLHA